MDSEWIDARIDGSDLRVGDLVRLCRRARDDMFLASSAGVVIGLHVTEIVTSGSRSWARDRTIDSYRWQYHAPTRAKLEAADRVAVTSITSDTTTVQPAPPPDSEPGWDHVPAEWYPPNTPYSLCAGDRTTADRGAWKTAPHTLTRPFPRDVWIRRASHPERVRWLEEQKRAVNTDSAIVAAVDSTATYARAPATPTFPDECKPLMHFVPGEIVAPVAAADPFAAVRAEAKRMMDSGADPRVVLGALDECVRREDPSMWKLQLAYYTVEATKSIARGFARIALGLCYHGNRAGTCGWCALSRDRSDARAAASREPAWDTADCEGE